MVSESKEFIIAKDYDELVTLFYSDLYFQAIDLTQDEAIAKGVTKKVFEIAQRYFNAEKNNNFTFLEAILQNLSQYQKKESAANQAATHIDDTQV